MIRVFLQRLASCFELESPSENAAGFTLIEVIAALAILSVAVGVLFATLSDGFFNQNKARGLAQASSLAQSILARAGTEFLLQPGVQSGEESNGLRWKLSIMPYGTPADREAWPVDAFEINVEVFVNDQSREPVFSLKTLRLEGRTSHQ